MVGPAGKNASLKRTGRYLSRLLMVVVCLLLLMAIVFRIYLATPLPVQQVSSFLTSYLHQKFTIESLNVSGGTLYLRGARLDNPPGFSKQSMAAADSVAIAPQWDDLLLGRQRFRLLSLDGIKVALEKDSNGNWNFAQLQRLLAARKPAATETRIRELTVKNSSISIDGQEVGGVALQIFNLTTRGSLDSRIDLAFEDMVHNRFTIKGDGRAGTDPAVDLTLSAPALALKEVATLLTLKNPGMFAEGTGSLLVNVGFHKGELSAAGTLSFSHLRYSSARRSYSLNGSLQYAADYSLAGDVAHLKNCLLQLNDHEQLHASGTLRNLKKERSFALDLGCNELDLGTLNALVPEEVRRKVVFGGRLGCRALHVAGNGGKVSATSGTLQLHDGTLAQEGSLLAAGLAGTIRFSRAGEGVLAKGRLTLSGPHGEALLESLELPFQLALSSQLKLLRAETPALSLQAMGMPCYGRLAFDASQARPLAASLKVSAFRVAKLKPLLERYGLAATSGTAALALEATGSNAQQFAATIGVQLADFQGSRGKDSLTVAKGSLTSRLRRGGGQLLARGTADLTGLTYDGQGGAVRFNYQLADRTVSLEGTEASVAGAQISIAHLSTVLPVRNSAAKATLLPISINFDGCNLRRNALELNALSGRVRGNLQSDPAGKWFEGGADLAVGRVSWQGNIVAAPVIKAAFSRSGAKGDLAGKLLGGALAGSVSGNLLALQSGARFDLSLTGASAAAIAPFIPKSAGSTPSDGLVDLHCLGAYSRSAGLSCRVDAKGSKVALSGTGGKALVSDAAFSLAGELAGEQLSISEATLYPGQGVALKLKGKLTHPFSPQRAGSLTFSLPQTQVSVIAAALSNLLPRVVQTATINGTLAADGTLDLEPGKKLLEGSLLCQGGHFEAAQQKLAISGIDGRIPFSLDLSGKAGGKPPRAMPFSRENYPTLQTQLSRVNRGGELLSIGKMSFGPVELGALTMRTSAANGITEISSLDTTLFAGAVLGKGFLSLQGGLSYRGDLLVNNFSLKRLCSIFPGIQGYISGRVDGVISVSGGAKGLAGLTGFTELWAHEGAGEKMLVSKEFLQRLAKQKLGGFFFRSDRSYDQAEIKALIEGGYLSFQTLQLLHTNVFGVRDLNVSIAPTQNRIALDHLLESIKQAAVRGKATTGEKMPAGGKAPAGKQTPAAAPSQEFKWEE